MKRFLVSAIAVVLLALSVSAFSASAQAGTIDLISSQFKHTSAGDDTSAEQLTPFTFLVSHKFGAFNNNFVDKFKFSINDITKLAFNVTTVNHVLSLTFALLDDHGNTLFTLTGFGAAGGTHSTQLSFTGALLDTLLASNFLTLKVTGAMCSCASYSISAVTPIPAALLMFLTALGGMGGLAWGRNKRQAVALRAA
jgi:hypothetical protein